MFDKVVYDRVDSISKQKLWDILEPYGYTLSAPITTEFYKETDIKTLDKNNQPVWFEIEVANKDTYFKYSTYFVNTRKSQNKSHKYVIFSSDYEYVSVVDMSVVLNSPIKSITTKRGAETVFSVNKSKCKIFKIQNGFELKRIK